MAPLQTQNGKGNNNNRKKKKDKKKTEKKILKTKQTQKRVSGFLISFH